MSRLNLQSKILLMVMPLVVLPLVLLGWYAYTTLEENSRRNLIGQMSTFLNMVDSNLQSHRTTVRANIELFAGSQLLKKYILTEDEADRYSLMQPALMRLFASYQRAYPNYYELRILLLDGYEDSRSTITPLPNKTEYEHDQEFFRLMKDSDTETYEMYTYNEDNGKPVLYVGRKLMLRDESFEPLNTVPRLRGYLVITADLDFLKGQLNSLKPGSSGYLFITDKDDNLLTWPGGTEKSAINDEIGTIEHTSALLGEIVQTRLQGEDVYLQGSVLNNDLNIYAAMPAEDLHSASRTLSVIVFMITLVMIIIVSVLVFFMINWILIRPIRRLGKAVHEIGHGRFDIDTDISSYDEIGELAHSFKEMSRNLKQSQQQVEYLAYRDALTGLPNRRMFRDYLEKSIAMARRQQNCLALLFMDLDNFKQINDTLGHQAGDRLLHEIARRLDERMRKEDHITSLDTGVDDNNMTDAVARLGGDEFLILLSDVNEPSDVAHTAERIQEVISEPFDIDGNRFFVGCSIGVSMFPNDGDDVDTLIRNADIAMYHAKDNGRNNYQFFNEHMNASAMARLAIENDLRSAISKNEFFLLYQPKIDLNSGEINSVEALIRWNHPDNGIIEPDDFIHVTESTSLILPIGEWVIREAARQAADWRKQGIKLSISINISTVQFNKQNLTEIIRNNIGLHKCDPECLEVELTETGIMDTYDSASRMLNDIRALGVKISMDDFGVGYSSFNHLRSLPIDSLKIDRSFVRDITTDHRDAEIVSAILAMAHTLNLKVIAEGVETKEQLDFLQCHNCDVAQGFLISYPLTGEEIVRFMRQYKTYDIINTDQSKQGISVVQKLKNNS